MKIRDINKGLKRPELVRSLQLSWSKFSFDPFPELIYAFSNLEEIDLTGNNLRSLPPSFFNAFPKLQTLKLSNNFLDEIPSTISNFENLKVLEIRTNKIKQLPLSIAHLKHLEKLDLSGNRLPYLTANFDRLQELKEINLSKNLFQSIPYKLGDLPYLEKMYFDSNPQCIDLNFKQGQFPSLRWLSLKKCDLGLLNKNENDLRCLPGSLVHLRQLEELFLAENLLESLHPSLADLPHLSHLDLSQNDFQRIPKVCQKTSKLCTLDMYGCERLKLDQSIGKMPALSTLILAYCNLTMLPEEIGNLQRLTHLLLDANRLTQIPSTINNLSQLKVLSLSKNKNLEEVNGIDQLPHLQTLKLDNTNLNHIPKTKGLASLSDLDISYTKVQTLPREMVCWQSLKEIKITGRLVLRQAVHLLKNQIKDFNRLRLDHIKRMEFMAIMDREEEATLKIPLTHFLIAANSRQDKLRVNAMLCISQRFDIARSPIHKKSEIVFTGRNELSDEVKAQLQELGITIAQSLTERTTHIVVGEYPYYRGLDAYVDQVSFLTMRNLQAYLERHRLPFLKQKNQEESIENLRQLLWNKSEDNVALALQMLTTNGVPESLINDLFILWKMHLNYSIRQQIKNLLNLNAKPEILNFIAEDKSDLLLASEQKIKQHILSYQAVGLDGDQIALYLFKQHKKALVYIFSSGSPEVRKQAITNRLTNGYLDLSRMNLSTIPKEVYLLADGITHLNISNNNFKKLPQRFSKLNKLKILDLGYNKLSSFPKALLAFTQLTKLSLAGNPISALPQDFSLLSRLRVLSMRDTQLTVLPHSVAILPQLEILDFWDCPIRFFNFPKGQLSRLKFLIMRGHQLKQFPESILDLPHLEYINLTSKKIISWKIPTAIETLSALKCILLNGIKFQNNPIEHLLKLKNLEYFAASSFEDQRSSLLMKSNTKSIYHAFYGLVILEFDYAYKIPGLLIT